MLAKDTHPEQALITREEQRQILDILKHNGKHHGFIATAQRHPLAGLVVCHECRSTCYSTTGSRGKQLGRNRYWQCKNWRLRSCNQKKMIRAEVIEEALITALVKEAKAINHYAQAPDKQSEPEEIRKLREEIDYYKNAPGTKAEGILKELEMELASALEELAPREIVSIDLIQAYQDENYWKQLTPEEKKTIYPALTKEIRVQDGKVIGITIAIP
jgi:hypothetical protein